MSAPAQKTAHERSTCASSTNRGAQRVRISPGEDRGTDETRELGSQGLAAAASTSWAVISRKLEPLGPCRRGGDAAFLKRAPKPLVHELFLRFPGLPDFTDDPPAGLRAAGVEDEPSRPVALAAVLVDSQSCVDRVVLLAADALELQDQPSAISQASIIVAVIRTHTPQSQRTASPNPVSHRPRLTHCPYVGAARTYTTRVALANARSWVWSSRVVGAGRRNHRR